METLRAAIEGVSGEPSEFEGNGPFTRLSLIATALLAAAAFSAIYGLAVGTTPAGLALTNVVKLPLIVVISGLFALPMGVLVARIIGAPIDGIRLWASQASATLAASLVLAAVAPMVGLFYYSSDSFGGLAAVTAAFGACGIGVYVFALGIIGRAERGRGAAALVPAAVLLVLQGMAVLQLIAVASPILPEVTPFAQGIEMLVAH